MVNTNKKSSIDGGGGDNRTDSNPRSPTKQISKQEEQKQPRLSPSNRKGLQKVSSKKAIQANQAVN